MRRTGVVAAVLAVSTVAISAWASTLTVTSKHLGAAAVTAPVMYPVSVTATDLTGTPGRIRGGDRITFVWSRPVDEPSLCSGWSNTSSTQSLSMTWTVTNGTTSDDLLRPAAVSTCATGLHVGTFDLGGAGYVSGTVTFTSSTVALSVGATTTTLTVTLGTQSGTSATSSGTNGTWTPDAAVTDRSAHGVGSNLATTASTVVF